MVYFDFTEGQIGVINTCQSEAAGRTCGTSFEHENEPEGDFELGKEPSPKGEVLELKIRVRIRVMERILIFFAEGLRVSLEK